MQATLRYITTYSAKKVKHFPHAMVAAAKILLRASRKIVPIDTKALYESGRVEYSGAGNKTIATVTYGDEKAYYAVWVHQDPTKVHGAAFNQKYAAEIARGLTHPRRPEERYKFLEEPARDEAVQSEMATEIARVLGETT